MVKIILVVVSVLKVLSAFSLILRLHSLAFLPYV